MEIINILLNGFGDNTGGYFSCFEPIFPSPVKIRETRTFIIWLSSVEKDSLHPPFEFANI